MLSFSICDIGDMEGKTAHVVSQIFAAVDPSNPPETARELVNGLAMQEQSGRIESGFHPSLCGRNSVRLPADLIFYDGLFLRNLNEFVLSVSLRR